MKQIITRSDFDDIIKKIEDRLTIYETSYAKDNNYLLFLGNGDTIKYTINKNNIAHLLGVNTNVLINNHILFEQESYNILYELIDNSYQMYNKLHDKRVLNNLFSNYIDDKLESFEKLVGILYPNQIEIICKYDRKRNYIEKEVDGLKADYYIGVKNSDGDLYLLGLQKQYENDDNNIYVPQTNRVIKNDNNFNKNLNDLLNSQVITFPTSLIITNDDKNYKKNLYLNPVELDMTLRKLESYSKVTDAIPNTLHGHIYTLSIMCKNRNELNDLKTNDDKISEITSLKNELQQLRNELSQEVEKRINIQCELDDKNKKYDSIKNDYDMMKKNYDEVSNYIEKSYNLIRK